MTSPACHKRCSEDVEEWGMKRGVGADFASFTVCQTSFIMAVRRCQVEWKLARSSQ